MVPHAQTSGTLVSRIRILSQPFDPEAALNSFRETCVGCGAVVSFTGVCRADSGTTALVLSHYEGYTQKVIASQVSEAEARFGLLGCLILHRVGAMAPGEPIVLVATASPHRRDAFEAADMLMDHLKSAAPFWKKEIGPAGERWIEPSARDVADRERWTG